MNLSGAGLRSTGSRGVAWAITLIAVFLSMSFGTAGIAAAQADAPSLVASGDDVTVIEGSGDEPDTYWVDEPGVYDITINGSNFSIDLFILECAGAGGSVEALAEGEPTELCNLGNVVTTSADDDGNIEGTFRGVTIDGCGLVFGAGDIAQTESAAVLVGVTNPNDDAECEVVAVDLSGYGDNAAVDTAGAVSSTEALADTGVNSTDMAIFAVAMLTGGALLVAGGRRIERLA